MQAYPGIIRRYQQSFLREHLADYRLKPVDGFVLHISQKKGWCNQETLCSIIDIDKGRMARIMERLENRHFIRRIVNPSNKREKLVEVTDEGLEMLQVINSLFDKWDEQCFEGFTDKERAEYELYQERIAKNAASKSHCLKCTAGKGEQKL